MEGWENRKNICRSKSIGLKRPKKPKHKKYEENDSKTHNVQIVQNQ